LQFRYVATCIARDRVLTLAKKRGWNCCGGSVCPKQHRNLE